MLSAKHHICYWILSIIAATVYHGMVTRLGYGEGIFRKILIPLLAFAVYITLNGPRPRSRLWHGCQKAATACLMVCLGAMTEFVYIPGGSAEPLKEIVHVLLAFSAIGSLESIRQNANIQPTVFSGCNIHADLRIERGWHGLVTSFYSHLVLLCTLRGICLVVDHVLASIYGPGVSSETIKAAYMNIGLEHLGSSIIILYALGPLEDVAQTVFYLVHRRVYPKVVPEPSPLVGPNQPWIVLKSLTAGTFCQWLFFSLMLGLRKMLAVDKWRYIRAWDSVYQGD